MDDAANGQLCLQALQGVAQSVNAANQILGAGYVQDGVGAVARTWHSKVSDIVNVKDFGAVLDGVTDDTTAIQNAITAATGGICYLPTGTAIVSAITIPTDTVLMGSGLGTVLKQKASTTGDLITLATGSTLRVGLANFQINGNKSNQSAANNGIKLDNTSGGSSQIPRHRINNIWIQSCKGSGLVMSTYTRESVVSNVNVYACDVYGFGLDGADSQYSNLVCGQSGDAGFRITGSGLMFVNCKSWFSGRLVAGGAGFLFRNSHQIIGDGLYSQENSGPGFDLFGQSGVLVGHILRGISDADNTAASTYPGVNVNNVTGARLDFQVTKFSGGAGTPYNGMTVAASSTLNNITLNADSYSNLAVSDGGTLNSILLNGSEYATTRIYGPANPTLIISEASSATSYFSIEDTQATQTIIRKVSAAGTAQLDFNPNPTDGTGVSQLRVFRETNTSGACSLQVFKGDNTATANCSFAGNTTSYVQANNSSFGVGTTGPDRKFHVEVDDASTNTVTYVERLTHTSTGTVATSFGVGLEAELENASGTNKVVGALDWVFTDATNATEDADVVVKLMAGGAAAAEKFRVASTGVVTAANEIRVGGDTGGAASTNTLTNGSDVSANSSGVGTILFKGATSRDSAGFIKFYVGTTAYYVPIFSAITG